MLEGQQPQASTAAQRHSRASLVNTRLIGSPYLSAEERQALEDVALTARSISAGTDFMQEGEYTDNFHIVIEGWACRCKTTRDGARQIVALLIPGDTANLDSFLFDRLDYGVRALTAIKVVTIPRPRILTLAEQHAGIAKTLTWLAMVENAILSQWALSLGRQSAKQQLAHLLCELSVRLGAGEDSFDLPLTQEQIADVLGLTGVHVNRMIQQLRAEGIIEARNRTMSIADMSALRHIGEFDPAYLHESRARPGSQADRSPVRCQRMSASVPSLAL